MKDVEFFKKYLDEQGDYEVLPENEYENILRSTGILEENRHKTILDVGCGSGAFSIRLHRRGFTNITGMDLSSELIAKAIQKNKNNEIRYQVGNILKMPFNAGAFDIIFCGGVIHHLPKQIKEVSAEFGRVLKSGGKIYFFEPYSKCLNSLLRYRILSRNRTEDETALDPVKLRQILEGAGFMDFKWVKLKGVECIYHMLDNGLTERIMGKSRKLVNEFILPNVYFAGSCVKK